MADANKFTDKAAEIAGQAAAKAGPLKDKATELAGQAAAKAGPLAAQAREKAGPLAAQAAAKAGPLANQARNTAAQHLPAVADSVDKLTKGKYSDKIQTLATKLGSVLQTNAPADPTSTAGTANESGAAESDAARFTGEATTNGAGASTPDTEPETDVPPATGS